MLMCTPSFSDSKIPWPCGRGTWLPMPCLTLLLFLLATAPEICTAQMTDSMSGSVLSRAGDYSYTGREYSGSNDSGPVDVAVDDAFYAVNYARDVAASSSRFIQDVTTVGGWSGLGDGDNYLRFNAGLRSSLLGFGLKSFQLQPQSGLKLGILVVDNLSIGTGVLYSEYSGTQLRTPRFGSSEENWAAVMTATFRLTAYVTNRFALSVRPYLYWLPLKNEFGYAAGGGLFSIPRGAMMPYSMISSAYRTRIAPSWDLSFYERLQASLNGRTLLNEPLLMSATLQDLSSYDVAGRYALGGFAPRTSTIRRSGQLSLNDNFFDNNSVLFTNYANAKISGATGENTRAHFIYSRFDQWNDSLKHLAGWNTASAVLVQRSRYFDKYATYYASMRDNSDLLIQGANVGFNAILGPNLRGFASGGHMWTTTSNERYSGRSAWVGRVGLEQLLGPNIRHGVTAGRAVTEPDFGSRYLADFVRYYLAMDVAPGVVWRLFYQKLEGDSLDSPRETNSMSEVYGSLISFSLTPLDSLSILNTHENSERFGGDAGWSLWSHRLSYVRSLREDLYAQLYYQYQCGQSKASGTDPFSEHIVYLGMVKRF